MIKKRATEYKTFSHSVKYFYFHSDKKHHIYSVEVFQKAKGITPWGKPHSWVHEISTFYFVSIPRIFLLCIYPKMDLLFPSKPVKWPRPPFVNYPNTQMSSLGLLVQVHSFQNLQSSIYQLQILQKECAVDFNEAQYIVNLVTGGKQDDGWANFSKHETPSKPSTIERICILASLKSRRKYSCFRSK